jgi:hypothetical protein
MGERDENLFAVIRKVSRTTPALRRQLQNDGNERGDLGKLASDGARG